MTLIVNVNNQCAPILTAMVYVWHCDKDGYYSGYNQDGADLRGQTFLRGVQATDTNGRVTFNTFYPGWYPGRATHIQRRVLTLRNVSDAHGHGERGDERLRRRAHGRHGRLGARAARSV